MSHQRTFLITGASRGIGWSCALYLHRLNHRVIGIARNERPDFPGHLFCADLSDCKQTESVLKKIQQNYTIDGVINNIGNVYPEPLETLQLDSFFNVLDLNLRPAIQIVQAVLPQMKKNGFGRIVNIASRAMLGKAGRSSYSAAKAALTALTKTWALELAAYQITVNTVAPGPIQTESFEQNYPKGSSEEQQLIAALPLKRAGLPEEVAYAIGCFLDERAGFMTGQTLFVDGGGSIGHVM
jgi:NAD(P)-dependent dehydrogenase (short-subunit alcohol dehydrogenase family)